MIVIGFNREGKAGAMAEMKSLDWLNADDEKRDAAVFVMPHLDYESQLMAIIELLSSHRRAEERIDAEIERAEGFARSAPSEHATDLWIEHVYQSTYQAAAHSMAAIGMIAPLMESIFDHTFREIGHLAKELPPLTKHRRLGVPDENKKKWDCHWAMNEKDKWRKDVCNGILQLADATGLMRNLPPEFSRTLAALFAYRNKMFHCGFEWPVEERKRFEKKLRNSDWPREWFANSTSNNEPWVYYMSSIFVDHCLAVTGGIITGIGHFCFERVEDGSLQIGCSEPMPVWIEKDLL